MKLYYLRVFLFLVILTTLTMKSTQAATHSIPLLSGWNLISIPLQLENSSIGNTLASIDGRYSAVYAYDSGLKRYRSYIPGSTTNDLSNLEPSLGYWIYIIPGGEGTLTISGDSASNKVNLLTEWNLVGYPSTLARPASEALKSIEGQYLAVYAFDTATNSYKGYVSGAGGELSSFEPGRGYWIYAKQNTVWGVPVSDVPSQPGVLLVDDLTDGRTRAGRGGDGGTFNSKGWTPLSRGSFLHFDLGKLVTNGGAQLWLTNVNFPQQVGAVSKSDFFAGQSTPITLKDWYTEPRPYDSWSWRAGDNYDNKIKLWSSIGGTPVDDKSEVQLVATSSYNPSAVYKIKTIWRNRRARFIWDGKELWSGNLEKIQHIYLGNNIGSAGGFSVLGPVYLKVVVWEGNEPANLDSLPETGPITPTPPMLINELFNASLTDLNIVKGGTWNAQDGKYVITNAANGGSVNGNLSVHNKSIDGDCVISVDGTISSAGKEFSLIFNYQDERNYYYVNLSTTNTSTTSGVFKVSGGNVTQVNDITTTIKAGVTYHLKVERVGAGIKTFLEGNIVGRGSDSTFKNGKVGVGSISSGATFDNLQVRL